MRAVLCCFLVVLAPYALAERWTIQVFAYAQASRAEQVAEQLRAVGYDAFTDATPATASGGLLTQVRIGCFGAQADAQGLAQDVRQRVALDALVVPLADAKPTVCAERELGFIPPANWGLESSSATQVSFWLDVGMGGERRTITFDGERWTLQQSEADTAERKPQTDLSWLYPDLSLPAAPPPGLAATFRATQSRGLPLIRADLGGGSLLVTVGELLWRSAQAAVVKQGADVFALRLYRP